MIRHPRQHMIQMRAALRDRHRDAVVEALSITRVVTHQLAADIECDESHIQCTPNWPEGVTPSDGVYAWTWGIMIEDVTVRVLCTLEPTRGAAIRWRFAAYDTRAHELHSDYVQVDAEGNPTGIHPGRAYTLVERVMYLFEEATRAEYQLGSVHQRVCS
jgi:hypothetical protein